MDLERNPDNPATLHLLQQIADRMQQPTTHQTSLPTLEGATSTGTPTGTPVRSKPATKTNKKKKKKDNAPLEQTPWLPYLDSLTGRQQEERFAREAENISSKMMEKRKKRMMTDEEDDPELPAGCQEGILNTLIQEMREERQQSQAQFKSIPQVQPMHAREFEDTQRARGNHKGNWVHTLLPLLNKQCKAVVMCLPAASKTKYKLTSIQSILGAWKETGYNLEGGSLNPNETAKETIEQVRQQIATGKLLQMLPGKAQGL